MPSPGTRTVPVPSASFVLAGQPLPVVSRLRVYTCGITPYDVTHLGHAAVFVWTDLLRSVARLLDVRAVTTRNVTDVDDVLTDAAVRHGRLAEDLAVTQEHRFDQDMAALGVRVPDSVPRAHTHVTAVVQLAAALLAQGAAYERAGHVVFRGAEVAARRGLDRDEALRLSAELGDQARSAGPDLERDDPLDVPVWRPSADSEPGWPSPWGRGRPGWHAECAAMALGAYGPGPDVLVGGADLAFPHHAYQAAMAEAVTGVAPFARRHLHVGTVGVGGRKMAKSTGNLVLVRDLLDAHPPAAVRLLLLDRPWAHAWDFEEAALVAAGERLRALYAAAGRPDDSPDNSTGDSTDDGSDAGVRAVTTALLDDLDVPRALDAALGSGGAAARLLVRVLGLGEPV